MADDDPPWADQFHEAIQAAGRPVVTTGQVAGHAGASRGEVRRALEDLAGEGRVHRVDVGGDEVVWYPPDWTRLVERERVVPFPDRRELVVSHPTQYTRAQLAQWASLVDRTDDGSYLYRVRREDVWNAPFDALEDLLASVRSVLPGATDGEGLLGWIEDQWRRADQFVLRTHPDGYTVLEAASEDLMGNVARAKLDEEQLHAAISETESWVREGTEAAIKRALYEAGYPVTDRRDLDAGEPLETRFESTLREYQRDWVDRFLDRGAGVLVGPPGSGKTVAALAALAEIGGETLVLVPGRELATQWREAALTHTSLDPDQVGVYHGGTKDIRPVTVATYRIAGMDRHRALFDDREWGLIVYDEVHHVPAPIHRLSADLQSKHRLGLSATPVREDDREAEIFTLVGPSIGADWDALFDAGFVAEPEVEIRYLPWADDGRRETYASADGRERHQLAATNPAKVGAVERILADHPDARTLVFVDYLDQGEAIARALDAPFVSGDTPHRERERLFSAFGEGTEPTLVLSRVGDEGIDLPDAGLAVIASGLGGSRRQGAQRAGRTMRPAGTALVYVLATRGTEEEEFVARQTRYLAGKGIHVRERAAEDVDGSGFGGGGGTGEAGAGGAGPVGAGEDGTGGA